MALWNKSIPARARCRGEMLIALQAVSWRAGMAPAGPVLPGLERRKAAAAPSEQAYTFTPHSFRRHRTSLVSLGRAVT